MILPFSHVAENGKLRGGVGPNAELCLLLQTAEEILNETCNYSFSNMHTSYVIVWNITEIFMGLFPGYKSNVYCRLLTQRQRDKSTQK